MSDEKVVRGESGTISGVKIVVAGPVGSGKTTFIRALTEREPVATEMPLVEGSIGDKTTTTVAMDFSTALLSDGELVHVFGLPGQQHFAFMRGILMEGAAGVVLLFRASDPEIQSNCQEWLQDLAERAPTIPFIVAVTHTDCAPGFSLKPLRDAVMRHGRMAPVFTFDAREREQVRHVVRAMLASAHG